MMVDSEIDLKLEWWILGVDQGFLKMEICVYQVFYCFEMLILFYFCLLFINLLFYLAKSDGNKSEKINTTYKQGMGVHFVNGE